MSPDAPDTPAGRPWLAAYIAVLATAAPLLERLMPLPRLVRLLTPRRPWPGATAAPEWIGQAVDRRLRNPRQMRRRACLRRGLVVFHMLRLAGYPAEIHFGLLDADADGRGLRGHCWVSLNGRIFGQAPSAETTVVWSHPKR